MLEKILSHLRCLNCGRDLSFSNKDLRCINCGRIYKNENGTIIFASENIKNQSTALIFKLKCLLKEYPRLFFFLFYALGVFTGKTSQKAIEHLPLDSLIINTASGIKIIRKDVINIDIYPFQGTLMAADAQKLPFKDSSCDAAICETSLEHIKSPSLAVQEIHRILKNNGLIYITVPFIQGFHDSPSDYYRWTKEGIRELLKNFEEKEIGIYGGPTYAFTSILREWLAIVLSFNSEYIYQVLSILFLIILAPLNFLDYLFSKYRPAQNIASSFYFLGIKK